MTPLPSPNRRLYLVKVKGGGTFLYDLIDVGRLLLRMAEEGDDRPVKVRRTCRLLGWR